MSKSSRRRQTIKETQEEKALKRRNMVITMIVGITAILSFIIGLPTAISEIVSFLPTPTFTATSISTITPSPSYTTSPTVNLPSNTQASTLTEQLDSEEWKTIIQYEPFWDPGDCSDDSPGVIPGSESWDEEMEFTIELLDIALQGKAPNTWDLAPDQKGEIRLEVNVRSLVESNEWIQLDKSIKFTIVPLRNAAIQNVHTLATMGGCGGEQLKYFSVANLEAGYESYEIQVSNNDYDFFTLEPGEIDTYVFYFSCDTPGIYQIKLQQQYKFKGESKNVVVENFPLIICPQEYRIWPGQAGFNKGADNSWYLDQGYIYTPLVWGWNSIEYKYEELDQ